MKKGTLILTIIIGIRVFASCIFGCECNTPTIIDFAINSGSAQLFGNHGDQYSTPNQDEIIASAIAMNIELTDSNIYANHYLVRNRRQATIMGIKTAQAMQCDCIDFTYNLSSLITDIHLITLLDYSDKYKQGDDIISDCYALDNSISYLSLYKDVCDQMEVYNTTNSYDDPEISFRLFLKEPSLADSIQLKLIIDLSNGSTFEQTTEKIALSEIE